MEKLIEWIDNASYEDLLRKWRFSPSGNPLFEGEVGKHYKKILAEKRHGCNHVEISKKVGWGNAGNVL
jgi:hypothetical protein